MARTLIAAAIVVGLLGACATPGFRMFGVTQPCDTPNCPIVEVTVEGNPPHLKASIDTLVMKHDNQNANIMWKLNAEGYKFQADSIAFKNPVRAATQFSLVNPTENMFHLKNKNKDDVYAYGYQIKVYEIATGIWIPLDPWVVNN